MSRRTKKVVGIVMMVAAAVGFVLANMNRDEYSEASERFSSLGKHTKEIPVKAGEHYRIALWGVDEETGLQTWASLKTTVTVTDSAGKVLHEKELVATESKETGGIRRAQIGDEFGALADRDDAWVVTVELTEGDHVDLEVFRGLSDLGNVLPGLIVILFVVGLVVWLRNRAEVDG